MRRAVALALAVGSLGACDLLTGDFRLNGTVEVADTLRAPPPKQTMILFVIAENEGGVPVAVLRIVNPEFPVRFKMGPADLLVPAVRNRERLRVKAQLNSHGEAGRSRPGDITGGADGVVYPGESGVRVVLDAVKAK